MSTDRVVVHAGIISDRLAAAINRLTPMRELHADSWPSAGWRRGKAGSCRRGHAGDLYAHHRERPKDD